ncbi:MAG: sulfite reductase [Gammaproteobacteria bacterium]|nr:sulfite reductase [Gammaproteobacteria bacterium]HBF07859.1 sulfite reductase [Gammaproteobacteria bacterium]|tara:strand:- start:2136 stop:3806 length:1671 start_codon:yes stop_codon:yes gene_type:complete
MYQYNQVDHQVIKERVAQFRDQTQRFINGELPLAEYLPLRLQNGLYVQRHAPMLRVAIPYGLLNSAQVRKLAHIAREYDKGYAHISTRQNMQFNWPALEQVPDILEELAEVEMHAIQTSGNCIRNVTTDQFAGVAHDEVTDPRAVCEMLRQWSTFHPEFAFLPRKFKIAVSADAEDRAGVKVHDIGIKVRRDDGKIGYDIYVGGGLGRTPMIGSLIKEKLEGEFLLPYLEAILRIYNRYGRRDNKYKARIKILVKALTPEVFAERVQQEFEIIKDGDLHTSQEKLEYYESFFKLLVEPLTADTLSSVKATLEADKAADPAFANWVQRNVRPHKLDGYANVTLSLKCTDIPPGDVSDDQLDAIADLADEFSKGQIRTTHFQNMVLTDVQEDQLKALYSKLVPLKLATANTGYITDIICCPGGDFCALANAKSIPVAADIQQVFDDQDYIYDLGPLDLNISGCMNACGHHHVGHIGILGVDKKGEEFYQLSVGGSSKDNASIGKILGPSISREDIAGAVKKVIDVYVEQRHEGEDFLSTLERIGTAEMKERVYAKPAS